MFQYFISNQNHHLAYAKRNIAKVSSRQLTYPIFPFMQPRSIPPAPHTPSTFVFYTILEPTGCCHLPSSLLCILTFIIYWLPKFVGVNAMFAVKLMSHQSKIFHAFLPAWLVAQLVECLSCSGVEVGECLN